MNNNELNLDQIRIISGAGAGAGAGERHARRGARRERRKERRDIREARREMEENLRNGRYSCGCGPTDGPCRIPDITDINS